MLEFHVRILLGFISTSSNEILMEHNEKLIFNNTLSSNTVKKYQLNYRNVK